jgi:hypothetical protein
MKDLKYYKKNCEEDYLHTPISVLRYITELEKEVESRPLIIDSVVGQSEQLFCGVKDGFCPYQESDMNCRAEHKCINQVAK